MYMCVPTCRPCFYSMNNVQVFMYINLSCIHWSECVCVCMLQVGCGESHVAVVTSENMVFMWGAGQHGQLGTGDEEDR